MKFIDKIKDKWFVYKASKVCSNLKVSLKGQCLINYLVDIINDKDVYIEEYEQALKPFISEGYSRKEAAKYQLDIMNAIIGLGAKPYENN
jgi:hypothetical protein